MNRRYTINGNEIRMHDPLNNKDAIIEMLDIIYSSPTDYDTIYIIISNWSNRKITLNTLRDSSAFAEIGKGSKDIFRGPTGETIVIEGKRDLMRIKPIYRGPTEQYL